VSQTLDHLHGLVDADGNAQWCSLFGLSPSHLVSYDNLFIFQPLLERIRELCAVNFLDVQLGFLSAGVGKPAGPPDVLEATARLDNREGCLMGGFGQKLSPEY